jgi:SAM-dependent methyltransferase
MTQLPYPRWTQIVSPTPKRHLQKVIMEQGLRTGLDIGCGDISCLSPLRQFGFHSTGLDVWQETIDQCRQRNVHDVHLLGNFMEIDFPEQFDVVILSHVIEHFDRDTGMAVLRKMEKLARHLVYVETPIGFLEQPAMRGNPWQRHFSGWFPHDFEVRGYNVYGAAPKFLFGPRGLANSIPDVLARQVARLLQFYYFRRPKSAFMISGLRFMDKDGMLRLI